MGEELELSKKIEELRNELNRMVRGTKNYDKGKILETSMKLDALINEYLRMDRCTDTGDFTNKKTGNP
jgi:RNA-binding protein YlmH